MWLKERRTKKEFKDLLKQYQAESPDEHIYDILFEKERGNELIFADAFTPYGASYGTYSDFIESGMFERLTQEDILECLKENDFSLTTQFLRKYRDELDQDEMISIYEAAVANDNFHQGHYLFISECGIQGEEFNSRFKDTLRKMAFEEIYSSAIATYVSMYGMDDVGSDDIKNAIKTDLSNVIVFFKYPEKVNVKQVHSIFNELTDNEVRNAVKIRDWHYTPLISDNEVKLLNNLSGSVSPASLIKNNLLVTMSLLDKVSDRNFYPFALGKNIKTQRNINMVLNKIAPNNDVALER